MRIAPSPIILAFAEAGDRVVIPAASQIGVTNGKASYPDGFPPLTRLAKRSGGTPPSGLDMNGILFDLSAYCAWLQGGGKFTYSAAFVAQNTGYHPGAILQSAADPTQFFYNETANNSADPDLGAPGNGWIQFSPLSNPTGTQAANIGAGLQSIAVASSTGFLDLTPNVGPTTLTDLTGGRIGQTVLVSNESASNALTIQAGATIRMSSNLTLLQNGSITLRKRTVSQWVALNG